MIIEVRFHGRGGQGAVTASKIIANAFVRAGKYGAAFPMFGFERRGAPVSAFGRFGDTPIRLKTQIYKPDCLVILDSSQKNSDNIWSGLKPDGIILLNTNEEFEHNHSNIKTAGIIDAAGIALEEIGIPIPNTCIVGAFAAVTGLIDIELITESLSDYFDKERLRANIKCAERGYNEVKIHNF